jgi:hypothetical protein
MFFCQSEKDLKAPRTTGAERPIRILSYLVGLRNRLGSILLVNLRLVPWNFDAVSAGFIHMRDDSIGWGSQFPEKVILFLSQVRVKQDLYRQICLQF